MDYMQLDGSMYGVFADRHSHWVGLYMCTGGSHNLIGVMIREFAEHGIPKTCTTDGGPRFTAHDTKRLFADWGIDHRITSVANPDANCRAEVAVKTIKRMIGDNAGPHGKLDSQALVTYRNTADRDTGFSPAEVLYGLSQGFSASSSREQIRSAPPSTIGKPLDGQPPVIATQPHFRTNQRMPLMETAAPPRRSARVQQKSRRFPEGEYVTTLMDLDN